METGVHSKIVDWSMVDKETVEKQKKRKTDFQYWGPTPKEARKAAVAKKKGLVDKRMTLKEAVDKHVKDGMNIGVGGFVNTRVPTAIVWNIIKKGAKDLTLSFPVELHLLRVDCRRHAGLPRAYLHQAGRACLVGL